MKKFAPQPDMTKPMTLDVSNKQVSNDNIQDLIRLISNAKTTSLNLSKIYFHPVNSVKNMQQIAIAVSNNVFIKEIIIDEISVFGLEGPEKSLLEFINSLQNTISLEKINIKKSKGIFLNLLKGKTKAVDSAIYDLKQSAAEKREKITKFISDLKNMGTEEGIKDSLSSKGDLAIIKNYQDVMKSCVAIKHNFQPQELDISYHKSPLNDLLQKKFFLYSPFFLGLQKSHAPIKLMAYNENGEAKQIGVISKYILSEILSYIVSWPEAGFNRYIESYGLDDQYTQVSDNPDSANLPGAGVDLAYRLEEQVVFGGASSEDTNADNA